MKLAIFSIKKRLFLTGPAECPYKVKPVRHSYRHGGIWSLPRYIKIYPSCPDTHTYLPNIHIIFLLSAGIKYRADLLTTGCRKYDWARLIPATARPILTGQCDLSCYSAQKLQQEPKVRIHSSFNNYFFLICITNLENVYCD